MIRLRLAELNRRHIALAGAAALVVVATAAAAVALWPDPSDALRRDLEAEFDGAYPAEPAGGGDVIDVDLTAAETTVALVDGVETDVWAYNGTVPGPALRIELGDTIRVHVRNDLDAATTIHWHGIRVPNDMDGVPDVNQPRIEPGATFVYEFTPPDAGTYWYHSHTDGSQQLVRGLYGSIVVDDPGDGTDYGADEVWILDDWLLDDTGQIDPAFNTPADRTHNGRWGNLITVNASTTTELKVAPGARIRLRLVSASNGRVYVPHFGDLDVTVVAVDGLTVGDHPDLATLTLAPGNRIDVDITTPTEPGTHQVVDTFTGGPQPLATIVVDDTTDDRADALSFEPATNPAVPDWDTALEAPVDHELLFETRNEDDEWIWTINGAAYPDHEPLELTAGEFTKIRLVNQTHPMHPIHLHGQFFKVLTRNGEPVDEPYFRDTVLLEMLDEVEIGLVPLDVGDWVLNCHIQEHGEAGMMTVMQVAPDR
ncbi:MAG: multicopper oxidase family protein [Acidimicrobiales bacterium]